MEIKEWLSHLAIEHQLFYDTFGESDWVNPYCYVWRQTAKILKRVENAVLAKSSPIIPIGGMYGSGKSAFKWALQYVLAEKDVKVISTRLNHNTTEYGICTQIADSLEIRDMFGGSYPENTNDILHAIEQKIKQINKQIRPCIVIDDSHFMQSDAFFSIKSICDIEENGRKICPIILLGEYVQLEESLKKGSLAQVSERAQMKEVIEPFTQVDGFELIARGLSFARNDPLPIDYNILQNQEDTRKRCRPFTDLAVSTILEMTRLPRQIKQLCARAVQIKAEQSDNSSQEERFIVTDAIINDARASLSGWIS